MKRGVLLAGLVLVGTAGVVLIAPVLMHSHHHHLRHASHLRGMADGALAYYDSDHAASDGELLPTDLPPSVGPTPTGSICGDAVPASESGWALLRYAPPAQMRSTYIRESATTFVARINGDVDCDGIESTFERRCVRREDGFDCTPFEAHVEE